MANNIKQDILFIGGTNSDDMRELVPQGDYLSAVNIRNLSKEGNNEFGKITPRKGNLYVANPFYVDVEETENYRLLITDRRTVGSVRDDATNKIYYFVYELYGTIQTNIVSFWSIYEYDNTTEEITNQVVRTTLRIFDQDSFIKFGAVLYGRLFWTQADIEPKSIDIERAINYTLNTLQNVQTHQPAYTEMFMRDFNVYRIPPIRPIKTYYISDSSIKTNAIRGKMFQFRYRYVYNDNTYSVWSAISKVALPSNELLPNGSWNESVLYNCIMLTFNIDSKDIKEIHIAKREYDGDTKQPSNFQLIERLSLDDLSNMTNGNGDYYYVFYNNVAGIELSSDEEQKLLDYVPLSANAMEVVMNPDKIIYGGDIVEPLRDNIVTNVTLEVVKTEVAEIDTSDAATVNVVQFSDNNVKTYFNPRVVNRNGLGQITYTFNYGGVCSSIYFPVGFEAETINIKLTFDPNSGAQSSVPVVIPNINISGVTNIEDLKTLIVNAINSHVQTAYGLTSDIKVAYKSQVEFESGVWVNETLFADATNTTPYSWRYRHFAFRPVDLMTDLGGSNYINYMEQFNTMYGYGDTNFESNMPTDTVGLNRCVFIRTGFILELANGEAFQDIIVDGQTLTTSLQPYRDNGVRLCGSRIGLSLLNQLGFSDNDFYYNYFYVSNLPFFVTANENSSMRFKKITESDYYINHRGLFKTNSSITITDEQVIETPDLAMRETLTPFGKYGVGIVYFDEAFRPCYVQPCDDIFTTRDDDEYDEAIIYKIQMNISHFAPTWAKYWMPVITKNKNQQDFFEIDISIDEESGLIEFVGDNQIKIRVNDAINLWFTEYQNTLDELKEYQFAKGDRIILYNLEDSQYFDKEILRQDDEGYIYVSRGDDFDAIDDISRLIHIYTPRQINLTDYYFEIGELNDVISGGYHRDNKTNNRQTTLLPLEYIIDAGDIYLNSINNYRYLTAPEEDAWQPTYNKFYRPFYPSRLNSYGRVHIANKTIETSAVKDRIRISNATADNSFVKNWNGFEYNEKVDLGEKFGSITGLVMVGYTLKAITENKLISIYINRSAPVNPDGTEDLIITNRTIGAISIPEYDYGCKNPESIIKNDRNLYYINIDNGYVIRDSANGQFPISNYKMASFFYDIFGLLRKDLTNKIKVFGGFNKDDEEYIMVFNDSNFGNTLNLEEKCNAVVFNEATNRFVGFITQYDVDNKQPEWVDFVNNRMVTFIDGKLWLENHTDVDRNSYYGVVRQSNVTTICNISPKDIKTFHGIAVHATDKWSMPINGDISIPETTTYPNGMSSRLKANKLVDKEGIFYSEFMGDGNTNGMTYIDGLLNGNALRGSTMTIKLRNLEPTEKSELFSLSIRFKLSELNY